MEHNTDRILWTVLILAIGVALYVGFRPAANGLIHQSVDKIQTVATSVNGNPSDSSSSSSSSTNTTVGANLLTGSAKFDGINIHINQPTDVQSIQKYDDETNYIQDTTKTPENGLGSWWVFTPTVGKVYTLSADVCGNGYISGGYFRYEGADNGNLGQVNLTNNWQRISNTFRVNTTDGWRNWVCFAFNSTSLKIKHIKIEEGPVATPWVP